MEDTERNCFDSKLEPPPNGCRSLVVASKTRANSLAEEVDGRSVRAKATTRKNSGSSSTRVDGRAGWERTVGVGLLLRTLVDLHSHSKVDRTRTAEARRD